MNRMLRRILPGTALLGILLVAGCDSDSGGESASAVVGPTGGEVVVGGGEAVLTFPPGAVSGDVEVTINTVSGAGVDGLATDLYELGPSGVTFGVPVALTIKVAAGVATDGIYLAKVVGNVATPVDGSRFDAETRELSANLASFSRYGGIVPASLDDCQECAKAMCPTQLQACEDSPACNDILGCIDDCIDGGGLPGTCIDNCLEDHPGGVALFEAMADCTLAKCPNCEDGDPTQDPCMKCVLAKCPSQLQACEAAAECNAILDCMDNCSGDASDTCFNTCITQHPDGNDLFDILFNCLDAECAVCQEEEPDDIPTVTFNGTLYVYPEDSVDGANVAWGLEGRVTNASSSTNGKSNTQSVVSTLGDIGADYAAKVCSDLDSHGHSDWYLPSRDELNAIYNSRNAVGGFFPAWYWSSTEDDDAEHRADRAYIQNFEDGFNHAISKGLLGLVRCVRRN